MQKAVYLRIQLLAIGLMLGIMSAQQNQPTTKQSTKSGSSQTTPAKTQKTPAIKKTASSPPSALSLKTQREKESYALGMKIGSDMRRQGLGDAVDPAIAARAFKDALGGSKPLLTDDEERAALMQLQSEVVGKQQAKAHEAGAAARKQGDAFLAENKGKPGVVTLPSGLEYKVLSQGNGPKPTPNDTVTCNYRGTLLNGKEFDSSYARGKPETFPVSGVIKGWTEALQLMPVGSKWQLFIPADLAYGDRGAGADIGPGETLIFDVELLSIGAEKK